MMTKAIEFMPPVRLREYLVAKKPDRGFFDDVTLTFRGRDAIFLAVQHFRLEPKHTVLLPGYLCDTVSAAFNGRCNFVYYDINGDFSINAKAIEKLLSDHDVRVLYIIHYFGFLHYNLPQLSRLCKKYRVLLWEDCAHSAFSRISYEYADAMFFSFRKVLFVPDGGGLWMPGIHKRPMIGCTTWLSNVVSLMILGKRFVWSLSKRLRKTAHIAAQRNVDSLSSGLKDISAKPISHMSGRIVRSVNIDDIFHARRKIFRRWQSILSGSRFGPVFSELPDEVCPQGFPIWIANPEKLVDKLEDYNVFLKIHWHLPDEIAENCPVAWKISRSIVTLPIYPGLEAGDMQKVASLLDAYGTPLNSGIQIVDA